MYRKTIKNFESGWEPVLDPILEFFFGFSLGLDLAVGFAEKVY